MKRQLGTVAKIASLTIAVILAVVLAIGEKDETEPIQSEAVCTVRVTAPTQTPTPTQVPAPTTAPTHTPKAENQTVITGDVGIPRVTEMIAEIIAEEKKAATPTPEPTGKPDTEDVELLAEVMYWENWYTDKEKLTARWTGAVVMNRVRSKKFPNTVKDVLYQTKPCIQYGTTGKFFTEKLPEECYEMARDILENGTPDVPENVVYQSQFLQGSGLWQEKNGEYFCYE